jgi:hypothetical protein
MVVRWALRALGRVEAMRRVLQGQRPGGTPEQAAQRLEQRRVWAGREAWPEGVRHSFHRRPLKRADAPRTRGR